MPPPPPSKVIAVHLSYASRAAQRGVHPPHPSYFLKPTSSVHVGDGVARRPHGCELLGFEGEVGLVIGRDTRRVDVATARTRIAGVRAANDLGVYDLKHADKGANLRSKGLDGFTPLSADLIPIDGVEDDDVVVRTWHGAELVQDSTGDTRLWSFAELVADLSRHLTLLAGDVIITGTPAGASVAQPGEAVTVAVEVAGRGTVQVRTTIEQDEPWDIGLGAGPQVDDALRDAAYGR